jgi:hypothetical protein
MVNLNNVKLTVVFKPTTKRGQMKKTTEVNEAVHIKELELGLIRMQLVGCPDVPMVMHRLATKHNVGEMLSRQLGIKISRKGKIHDPLKEYNDGRYLDNVGRDCVPTHGIKLAICSALQFLDVSLSKAMAKRIIQVNPGVELTPIEFDSTAYTAEFEGADGTVAVSYEIPAGAPRMRQDVVRLSGMQHAPDIRFRPEYLDWSLTVDVEYPKTMITPESIVNLVSTAGKFVGLGESRPEKGGEWGTFTVKTVNV